MDINAVYNKIMQNLRKSGYDKIALDLDNLVASGVTGSEILFSTGKYLFDLKKNNHLVYERIKEFIEEYLQCCRKSGIIIR